MSIERVVALLLVASIVSMLARRVKLPYTVGLVAAGVGISLLHLPVEITLTRHLVFSLFLPPLLFEAAFQMPWKGVRRDLPVTLTLATLGVLIAAAVVTIGLVWILGWSWQTALLFGVLISATDPVSVIATFKTTGVVERLGLLVEAESLFNDGTAAVLFGVALAVVGAGSGGVSAPGVVFSFLTTVLGGILCGAAVGGVILLLTLRTGDHLVEVAFTTVAAFGSFLLAENLHLSGVLATLTAGMLLGNIGSTGTLSAKGHEAVLGFWEYAGFVANSLIFLLIGMPLAHTDFGTVWRATAVAAILVLLGRAISVYGCCPLFLGSRMLRLPAAYQHVLFWGGLRGALALALVLGLPTTTPMRGLLTTVTFGVVAFSIVVQGITMTPLLRRLGVIGGTAPTEDDTTAVESAS